LTYANELPLRLGDVLPIIEQPFNSNLLCSTSMPGGFVFNERIGISIFLPDNLPRIVPSLDVLVISYFKDAFAPGWMEFYRWSGFSGWAKAKRDCFIREG
jgi:hypothetical protein